MIKKVAIAVFIIMIASLSVAGCTSSAPNANDANAPFTSPAQTMTPRPDFTAYYERPVIYPNDNTKPPYHWQFTRSTNARGNDVYTTVDGNSTITYELAKTKAESQQIFNKTVADKQKNGFTIDPKPLNHTVAWAGERGVQYFRIAYGYNPEVSSWEVNTENNTHMDNM
ncbi:MAG: hypothetical protein ACXV39_13195 [Halobacteriota archaeon]